METTDSHNDSTPPNTIARLAAGTLDAATLADDTLARIGAQEAALGAFTALLPRDVARREAATAQLERRGPLHGLPVAVKDIVDTAALPTAYGSPLHAGHRPRSDAALVGAIRRAGGVVVGKTTSTEFAYLHPTATRNPNAAGRTPGGSSAGSAAAVAAGLVELAIGTQTGGSVIRPASYCGAVHSGLLPVSAGKGRAVPCRISFTSSGVSVGSAESISAAVPATSGAEKLVPTASGL